jgi:hypothetical protein
MNKNPSAAEQFLMLVVYGVVWYVVIRFIFFPLIAVIIATITGAL